MLNLLCHFMIRDLLPFIEILNMPGIPELLATVLKYIDGKVTIKQTYDVVGGVTT